VTSSDRGGTPLWTRLPALLLIAVALWQLALARSVQLSAWVGGGFGMFSTTDSWGRRHLHAVMLMPGARRELDVPASLREPLRRALALPTDARLRAFGRELWQARASDEPVEALELTVYATRFDPHTLAPSGELLSGVRVELRDAQP
jgi:hypothetical protein